MAADTLHVRIAALTPGQRALLAMRAGVSGPRRGGHLVAWLLGPAGATLDNHAVKAFVQTRLPEYMVPQVLVGVDELPRTAAGKVDRRALAARGLETDEALAGDFVAPRNDVETKLAAIWADVLGFDDIGVHDDFFEVGGDSLLSIRILSRAGKAGLRITPEKFFAHPTIAEQAAIASVAPTVKAETAIVTGTLPLTPIQHWFFERIRERPQQWNQSLLFALRDPLTREQLERAVHKILLHHDALRTSFHADGGVVRARIDDLSGELPLSVVDLGGLAADERRRRIAATAAELNAGFELSRSPLIAFAYFCQDDEDALLIVAHHLVVDAESWRILRADFAQVCTQLRQERAIELATKASSIKTWSKRLVDYANGPRGEACAGYWRENGASRGAALPVDRPLGPAGNLEGDVASVTTYLDAAATETLVYTLPQVFNSQINDALMSALARVLSRWCGSDAVCIDMEGHGREALFDDIDIARTVGWFTSVFPVTLKATGEDTWTSPVAALRAVKEQLRAVPLRGMSHGLLRELTPDSRVGRTLRAAANAKIVFNYLGQVAKLADDDEFLRLVDERCGPARHPATPRAYLIEVNAQVVDARLRVDWAYAAAVHDAATIEALAAQFLAALGELVAASASPDESALTPSDFPLANLDQAELDGLSDFLDNLDDDAS